MEAKQSIACQAASRKLQYGSSSSSGVLIIDVSGHFFKQLKFCMPSDISTSACDVARFQRGSAQCEIALNSHMTTLNFSARKIFESVRGSNHFNPV